MRSPRALIVLLLACLVALGALTGGLDATLTALPFVALMALLVSGRYVGEAQILSRRAGTVPVRRRRVVALRPPRLTRVSSVFARAALSRRGPPVAAFA
jgi:hypothetical protein